MVRTNNSSRKSILIIAAALFTAPVAPSQVTTEYLWPNLAGGPSGDSANFKPSLISYPVTGSKANGAAVLICPGGGYYGLAETHEGTEVAKRFNSYGVSAFIVKYRRAPGFMYPIPFDDGRRAMRIIRSRASKFGIDTARIGIMGFSAGGHLASTLAVHYDTGDKSAKDSIDRFSCRPAFAVLAYPVISMQDSITHSGSKKSLLGTPPDPNLVQFLSNERQVTSATPPTFLVHTKDDAVVKIANSQVFYNACVKAMVKAKFLQFPTGPHGFGLANGVGGAPNLPALAGWPDSCSKWLDANGFYKSSTARLSNNQSRSIYFGPQSTKKAPLRDVAGRMVELGVSGQSK